MTKLAIIGLGAMGARMAHKLLDAGHVVTVYNRTASRTEPLVAAGAGCAETPRAAAAGSDVVISMVTDDEASEAIWLDPETGALAGMTGGVALECSTLTPGWVRRLASHMATAGVPFLDAPVAGSRPQAEAGGLIYLVGGAADALARVQPVLEVMGSAVHHCGPTGAGAIMKLAVNAYFAVQVAALAELNGLLARADLSHGLETLTALPVTSPALKGIGNLIASGAYAPMFPIDLVEKDLRYAMATGRAHGARLPTTEACRDVFASAREHGFGGDNIHGVARLFSPAP